LIDELVEWSFVLRIGPSNCVGEHISVVHDHWVTVHERLLGNRRCQRWHKALSRYSPRPACRGHCAWDQSNCGPACQHLTCSPSPRPGQATTRASTCVTKGHASYSSAGMGVVFFMGRLCDKISPARLKIPREANTEFSNDCRDFFSPR